MNQRRARAGIIVPTALFVAMFVLLLSTVLVASVSQNLNLSLGTLEATESRYLSFAVVNELLSDLSAGTVKVDQWTRSSPRTTYNEGYTSESWVEQLADGNVLVVAQTRRSSQSKPEVVKRLAVYKDYDLTRVYTNRNDNNPNTPDPVFYSEASAGAWSKLPDFPRQRLKDDGTVDVKPGEKGGTLFWLAGAPDGSMYGVYSPTLDGWGDVPSPLNLFPANLIPFPWGKITLKTLVAGTSQGMTVGDLTPIAQCLINNLTDFSVTKGAVFLKYDFSADEWKPLPPPEEATIGVDGKVVRDPGNYHVKGAGGVPATYEGGALMPVFRKGADTIYRYTESTREFEVLAPPDKDVILMAADQQGTPFVQTGTIQPVGVDYFLRVLFEDFSNIKPQISGAAMWKREGDQWVKIPDPPAQFYNKGGQLVDCRYSPGRGPVLGGMTGGENGEFYVCNRPERAGIGDGVLSGAMGDLRSALADGQVPDLDALANAGRDLRSTLTPRAFSATDLVDTIYKYNSQGEWELVPSPPNKKIDPVTGDAVDQPGLPENLEIGQGSNGRLIIRETGNRNTPDPLFVQTQGGSWDLLPSVRTEGGPFEVDLAQISGGRRREGTRGSYVVKATYF